MRKAGFLPTAALALASVFQTTTGAQAQEGYTAADVKAAAETTANLKRGCQEIVDEAGSDAGNEVGGFLNGCFRAVINEVEKETAVVKSQLPVSIFGDFKGGMDLLTNPDAGGEIYRVNPTLAGNLGEIVRQECDIPREHVSRVSQENANSNNFKPSEKAERMIDAVGSYVLKCTIGLEDVETNAHNAGFTDFKMNGIANDVSYTFGLAIQGLVSEPHRQEFVRAVSQQQQLQGVTPRLQR